MLAMFATVGGLLVAVRRRRGNAKARHGAHA
jgi:hypothetical protein